MNETIIVIFVNPFGLKTKCEIPIFAKDESEFTVLAEDEATSWFYDVANEDFSIYWRERGGTDAEYDMYFENYLDLSRVEWEVKID